MRRIACMILVLSLFICLSATGAEDDLLIADFEARDYGGWTATGDAFGDGPTDRNLPRQGAVDGFAGKRFVTSYHNTDGGTGTLTSPDFKIERDYVEFLIGGGCYPEQACVNLIVGGKVVRTATGKSKTRTDRESLDWHYWDTREFRGQSARLQVVDTVRTGWGHINVDQFVQTNAPRELVRDRFFRSMKVDKNFLLIPIDNSGAEYLMTITCNGRLEHTFVYRPAQTKDRVSWWAFFDVSEYRGKTLDLDLSGIPKDSNAIGLIELADRPRSAEPMYREKLRPQLRFSQQRGWNNDPNGMTWFDGKYHFCWQSNPVGNNWGNLYWGHAVSEDLVHWKELPYVLRARLGNRGDTQNRHPDMGFGRFISGCANVTRDGKTMLIAVPNIGMRIATSTDGAHFTFGGQLDIPGCDPHLIWFAPGKYWVMVTYGIRDEKKWMYFSKSDDLVHWKQTGSLVDFFECPQLVSLHVDGDANKTKWVTFGADGRYFVGDFDGKTFVRDHETKYRLFNGPYYAAQVFANDPKGRQILVGWFKINMPGMPFNQMFTVPMELGLKTTALGPRLTARPVEELKTLRDGTVSFENRTVSGSAPLEVPFDGDLCEIELKVHVQKGAKLVVEFGTNRLVYDASARLLQKQEFKPEGETFSLRVVIDRPAYEVFADGGLFWYGEARTDGGESLKRIRISTDGPMPVRVDSLDVHHMKGIWTE